MMSKGSIFLNVGNLCKKRKDFIPIHGKATLTVERELESQRCGLQNKHHKNQVLWMGRSGKWGKSEWTYPLVRRQAS